jgi:hypothetical protein
MHFAFPTMSTKQQHSLILIIKYGSSRDGKLTLHSYFTYTNSLLYSMFVYQVKSMWNVNRGGTRNEFWIKTLCHTTHKAKKACNLLLAPAPIPHMSGVGYESGRVINRSRNGTRSLWFEIRTIKMWKWYRWGFEWDNNRKRNMVSVSTYNITRSTQGSTWNAMQPSLSSLPVEPNNSTEE